MLMKSAQVKTDLNTDNKYLTPFHIMNKHDVDSYEIE